MGILEEIEKQIDQVKLTTTPKNIGKIVNRLGEALDGKGKVAINEYYPAEKIAPGVIFRQPVNTPLQTGLKAIDSMIPIGRGQRELIIGDRGLGKTAITL